MTLLPDYNGSVGLVYNKDVREPIFVVKYFTHTHESNSFYKIFKYKTNKHNNVLEFLFFYTT